MEPALRSGWFANVGPPLVGVPGHIRKLAPSTTGDYVEGDEDDRELQVVVLHRVAIAYWPDHAAREVRVVRIEENRGD